MALLLLLKLYFLNRVLYNIPSRVIAAISTAIIYKLIAVIWL